MSEENTPEFRRYIERLEQSGGGSGAGDYLTPSDVRALDAMLERMAREEQDDLDRSHGQHILDVTAAQMQQGSAEDPVLEVLRKAHQAESEAE